MAVQKSKSKGGQRKHGRESRRPTHVRYNSRSQRDKNKRKRVFRSNGGQKAVDAWNAGRRANLPRVSRGVTAWHDRKIKED